MSKLQHPQNEVEELFGKYLIAWNGRDFQGVADCFSEPSFYALPEVDISIPNRGAFVVLLQKVFAGLEAEGFSHTEAGQVSARACAERMAIVDVKSLARLRKDGTLIEMIDAHYIARRSDDGWKFTAAVVCNPGWEG